MNVVPETLGLVVPVGTDNDNNQAKITGNNNNYAQESHSDDYKTSETATQNVVDSSITAETNIPTLVQDKKDTLDNDKNIYLWNRKTLIK